jgi:hypothetical protein
VCSTFIRTAPQLQNLLQNQCKPIERIPQVRGRLAAGKTTVLPFDARHCCHATSMGAATAIEE